MNASIIYNNHIGEYDFGEGHPLTSNRLKLFLDFFQDRFSPYLPNIAMIEAVGASDEDIRLVHENDYIAAIQCASEGRDLQNQLMYVSADNLSVETNKIPRGIDTASRLIVGCAVQAAIAMMEDKCDKAIAFGGMHHARKNFGEGFCYYNDVAICAMVLKKKYGLERILILDTDAHTGNGTMNIFYNDPSVLFIDIHQDPRTVYPEIGFTRQIGEGAGTGYTVNIPFPTFTGEDAYKCAFVEIVTPLVEEFQPQAIIRNGGSDPHFMDPLTKLGLTLRGLRMIGSEVRKLADTYTGGKSVDLILSGYNIETLPHTWSALIVGLLDLDVDLSDFAERQPAPPHDGALDMAKYVIQDVKSKLAPYWNCMRESR